MLTFLRGVAIAQIVEGSLEGLLGLILVIYGLFADPGEMAQRMPDNPIAEHATGYALGVGLLLAGLGALRIVAGISNWNFRGWALGVTALFLGLLTVLSCYCSLTAIGLLGVGLFAYLNGQVREAFERRRRGASAREVADWLRAGGTAPDLSRTFD